MTPKPLPEIHRCACGNDAEISHPLPKRWYVDCPQPLNMFCWTGPSRETRTEAVEAWNELMSRAARGKR